MENLSPDELYLYLHEYYEYLDRGDDPDTARLRIIEAGCPIEDAKRIQAAAFEEDGL